MLPKKLQTALAAVSFEDYPELLEFLAGQAEAEQGDTGRKGKNPPPFLTDFAEILFSAAEELDNVL